MHLTAAVRVSALLVVGGGGAGGGGGAPQHSALRTTHLPPAARHGGVAVAVVGVAAVANHLAHLGTGAQVGAVRAGGGTRGGRRGRCSGRPLRTGLCSAAGHADARGWTEARFRPAVHLPVPAPAPAPAVTVVLAAQLPRQMTSRQAQAQLPAARRVRRVHRVTGRGRGCVEGLQKLKD